jgi:hypothetical protein
MMMVEAILLALGTFVALVFVLAPLLREESSLKSLRRPRPGTRHLHGLESVDVEPQSERDRRCYHCGQCVDVGYDYCSECVKPLP